MRPVASIAAASALSRRHRGAAAHTPATEAGRGGFPRRALFTVVALACLVLDPAQAQDAFGTLKPPPARDHGQAFAGLAGQAPPQQQVQAALRQAGVTARQLDSLRFRAQAWRNASGVSFVRAHQVIDGAPVETSYVRAAVGPQGQVLQLLTRLVEVPAGETTMASAAAPSADDAAAALRAALQRVMPKEAQAPRSAMPDGNGWRFTRAADDWAEPRVSSVWLPLRDGSLVRGWRVETHQRDGNRAHTTLMGPGLEVMQVIRRGSSAAFRLFPNSPAAGPAVITVEQFNRASPRGWVDVQGQTSRVLFGNNAIVGLDNNGDNQIDGGGFPIYDGQFTAAADLRLSPLAPVNQQASVQNAMALVNRIHDTAHALGFNEAAGNLQRDNFGRGGIDGDGVFVTVQDFNADGDANFAVSYQDGGFGRMQVGLQPSPLPTHEVQADGANWRAGAKVALFGSALTTTGLRGRLVRPRVGDGCSPLGESLQGQVALLSAGPCFYSTAVLNAERAGAVAAIVISPAAANHAFRMTGSMRSSIPAVQVGASDAQRLAQSLGRMVTLRLKAQQPPLLDGALDADLIYHEYAHGISGRMVGDLNSTRAAATVNEALSDTIAFLLTGNDRFAAYSFSESCFRLPGMGCRRSPWRNYPRSYADLRAVSIYDDSEIYTAAVWRLSELMGSMRRQELLAYVIDGLNYTPPTPDFEQARDGLLAAVANGPRPTDCALVWRAFAQFGLGHGSSAVWTNDAVRPRPSSVAPAQCRP